MNIKFLKTAKFYFGQEYFVIKEHINLSRKTNVAVAELR